LSLSGQDVADLFIPALGRQVRHGLLFITPEAVHVSPPRLSQLELGQLHVTPQSQRLFHQEYLDYNTNIAVTTNAQPDYALPDNYASTAAASQREHGLFAEVKGRNNVMRIYETDS
jgi:hypothetical protein